MFWSNAISAHPCPSLVLDKRVPAWFRMLCHNWGQNCRKATGLKCCSLVTEAQWSHMHGATERCHAGKCQKLLLVWQMARCRCLSAPILQRIWNTHVMGNSFAYVLVKHYEDRMQFHKVIEKVRKVWQWFMLSHSAVMQLTMLYCCPCLVQVILITVKLQHCGTWYHLGTLCRYCLNSTLFELRRVVITIYWQWCHHIPMLIFAVYVCRADGTLLSVVCTHYDYCSGERATLYLYVTVLTSSVAVKRLIRVWL